MKFKPGDYVRCTHHQDFSFAQKGKIYRVIQTFDGGRYIELIGSTGLYKWTHPAEYFELCSTFSICCFKVAELLTKIKRRLK